MKPTLALLLLLSLFISCTQKPVTESAHTPVTGTWKLLSGTLIEKGDTTITDYTQKQSFIKIINDTHFAFLLHDLKKGKDSALLYSSGGGKYILKDSTYTEHLEYSSDRNWEGHDFTFTLSIKNDTLVQKGVEKIDSLGINRLNIEKYVRLRD